MGTDIHIAIEQKVGDRWDFVGTHEMWRNYDMFAALAGVRNGFGFAGIVTGEPLLPIAEPKGLPEDLSSGLKWRLEDEQYGLYLGDHSYSWLTREEIESYDWDQPKVTIGVVEKSRYVEGELPDSFSAGITGRGIVVSDPEDVSDVTTHVRFAVSHPLRERVGRIVERLLGSMPSDSRIVFGFAS